MRLKKCKIVQVSVREEGNELPRALAIIVAPSVEEAENHARQELEHYLGESGYVTTCETRDLGEIWFAAGPTTIFLYSKGVGWIK